MPLEASSNGFRGFEVWGGVSCEEIACEIIVKFN